MPPGAALDGGPDRTAVAQDGHDGQAVGMALDFEPGPAEQAGFQTTAHALPQFRGDKGQGRAGTGDLLAEQGFGRGIGHGHGRRRPRPAAVRPGTARYRLR